MEASIGKNNKYKSIILIFSKWKIQNFNQKCTDKILQKLAYRAGVIHPLRIQ